MAARLAREGEERAVWEQLAQETEADAMAASEYGQESEEMAMADSEQA